MEGEGTLTPQQQRIAALLDAAEDRLSGEGGAPEALKAVAALCVRAGLFDRARRSLARLAATDPADAETRLLHGWALQGLGDAAAAMGEYREALRLDGSLVAAHFRLGTVFDEQGLPMEARRCYERALEREPGHQGAYFNKGLLDLADGRFEEGFRAYEARWSEGERAKVNRTDAPLWLGETALEARTLLVHDEQGLGDTLLFVRYVPSLVRLGGRVVLKVQPPLRTLMAQSFPEVAVVDSWETVPAHDLHCPLPSLPLACGSWPGKATFPQGAYLKAARSGVADFAKRVGKDDRLVVGLCWAAGAAARHGAQRRVPLADLRAILGGVGCRFVNLQKELEPHEAGPGGEAAFLEQIEGAFDDFGATAALVQTLDLVVTVDTSVAHLAGALGCPVWVLVPGRTDWRWGREGPATPWYPSASLFRQAEGGDWTAPLREVAAGLAKLAGPGSRPPV